MECVHYHFDALEAPCSAYTVPYLWHFIWNIKYVEITSSCRPHFADQWSMTLEEYFQPTTEQIIKVIKQICVLWHVDVVTTF